MSKDEIKAWLASIGKDRHWLAEQIGSTKGTIDQWFYKSFPDWAVKSIDRLANPLKDKASGLELTFTDAEFDMILEAMKLTGYTLRRDFYHDAITERAETIVGTEAQKKPSKVLPFQDLQDRVAEDPPAYGSDAAK